MKTYINNTVWLKVVAKTDLHKSARNPCVIGLSFISDFLSCQHVCHTTASDLVTFCLDGPCPSLLIGERILIPSRRDPTALRHQLAYRLRYPIECHYTKTGKPRFLQYNRDVPV